MPNYSGLTRKPFRNNSAMAPPPTTRVAETQTMNNTFARAGANNTYITAPAVWKKQKSVKGKLQTLSRGVGNWMKNKSIMRIKNRANRLAREARNLRNKANRKNAEARNAMRMFDRSKNAFEMKKSTRKNVNSYYKLVTKYRMP